MKKIIYLICICLLFISAFFGDSFIFFSEIFDKSSTNYMIFWELRVPRVLLAFFVGAILALAGLVFQTIFKNSLVTPYTLGVASGTTLFTAICIVFFPLFSQIIASVFGSIISILVLYIVSKNLNKYSFNTNSILLIGIALSFFYSSALMLVFYSSNLQENYTIVRFTLGSLDTIGYKSAFIICCVAIFLITFLSFYKQKFKQLLVSNESAFLKGMDVNKTNLIFLLLVTLCVGVSISFVGPIGFIGLVIPHILKLIYKISSEKLFLHNFFFGGFFLVFADFIARSLNTSSILPIGVVTSFIGAPFFIYLLIKK